MIIKLSLVLICAAGAACADASQACPPLIIENACTGESTATLTLSAPANAPAGLSFLISLPDEGIAATSLAPNASLSFDLPNPKGRQVTVAVVGLEPDGGTLAACCLSNQRVHLPEFCPSGSPSQANPSGDITLSQDLAIKVTLSPQCTRQGGAPICAGEIGIAGADIGTAEVTVSADLGKSLAAEGALCSDFVKGQALCRLPIGKALPFNLTLAPNFARGAAEVCAQIGIGQDKVSRILALQRALAGAGYAVGKIDGEFGPATLAALGNFAADAGLPPPTADIPPEILSLLKIEGFSDAVAENNQSCAQANVPKPPLACDIKTTRASGDTCACRFKGMTRVSSSSCACEAGLKLGANGCEKGKVDVIDTDNTPSPACDPITTVLRGGICVCRSDLLIRDTATTCRVPEIRFCPDGSPTLPGIPCPDSGPACTRFNKAGECCDDLGPEDPSCR